MTNTDDGNNGDYGSATVAPGQLRQVIEVGRVILADFTDHYAVFLDVPVTEVQDTTKLPIATLPSGKQSWAVANLMAALISETWPSGEIDLPSWFNDDLKWASDIINESDNGESGNVGTVSDNVSIKLLDRHGREM